jgi:hypothetical protein
MVEHPRHLAALVVAAGVVIMLGLSSCGSTNHSASPPATSGTTTHATDASAAPTTPTTADPRTQAFDGYRAALDALDHALSNPPNPSDPLLAQTMVDPMLTQSRNLASEWQGFGQAGKYPPHSVRRQTLISATVTGNQASLQACSVDDGIVYDISTGKTINDNVTTALDKATLTLVGGTWKLATRDQVQKWQGVAGCADDNS